MAWRKLCNGHIKTKHNIFQQKISNHGLKRKLINLNGYLPTLLLKWQTFLTRIDPYAYDSGSSAL